MNDDELEQYLRDLVWAALKVADNVEVIAEVLRRAEETMEKEPLGGSDE
jgi:vacuolar-type H+-ATPase catalytic subunit A/Vma1